VDGIKCLLSDWGGGSPSILAVGLSSSMQDLESLRPSIEKSDLLCNCYFEAVDPFIRIIHQPYFRKEIGAFRRDKLTRAAEFEALLFSMYAMTVSSLCSDKVQTLFGETRKDLLSRYQLATQYAMAKVKFARSHKILPFQALLHYLVSTFF
jgi:hypothetical protein